MTDIDIALVRSPVFEAMTPQGRRRLVESGRPLSMAQGDLVFRRGDPSQAIYVLLSGAVEVTILDEDGRTSVLARLGPGDLLGEMGAFSDQPRSADVTVSRRSQLWRIGSAAIREVLESEGRAAMALVALLIDRLRQTDDLVQRSQWLNVSARLAQVLIEREKGSTTLSQGELARLIGASREAVNRRLSEWRRLGWVEIGPSGLRVLHPESVQRLFTGSPN